MVLVYVDDIIITGNNDLATKALKDFLYNIFILKTLKFWSTFWELKLLDLVKEFFKSQRKYALEILNDAGFFAANPTDFPTVQNLKLDLDDGVILEDPSLFRRLMSRLLYLTITKSDLVYSVQKLSQFVFNPRKSHLDVAYRILAY